MTLKLFFKFHLGFILSFFAVSTIVATAGEVKVINATAKQGDDQSWTISVTLLHDDSGWDHYANRWDIIDADGNLLGSRELLHPHVNEQPFTRSLSSVEIPNTLTEVTIVANDSVHGLSNEAYILKLERN